MSVTRSTDALFVLLSARGEADLALLSGAVLMVFLSLDAPQKIGRRRLHLGPRILHAVPDGLCCISMGALLSALDRKGADGLVGW